MPRRLILLLVVHSLQTLAFRLGEVFRLGEAFRRPAVSDGGPTAAGVVPVVPDDIFEEAISCCERLLKDDDALEADALAFGAVPQLLRTVFDADFEQYCTLRNDHAGVQNVSCLRPADLALAMNPCPGSNQCSPDIPIRGHELMRVALEPGRVCADGSCSECGSRVSLPHFTTDDEAREICECADALMAPAPQSEEECCADSTMIHLFDCARAGDVRMTLLLVRIVERLRRAVAHEYGLPLASVAPRTIMISRWVSNGGCASGTSIHGDEAAVADFHYSTVLHLSTQGCEFEGGDFVFSDPVKGSRATSASASVLAKDAVTEIGSVGEPTGAAGEKCTAGRLLTRLSPRRGRALMFSSGWENLHFVDEITSGVRHAMPVFFVTRAAWAHDGPSDMRGPVSPHDVGCALLQRLFNPGDVEDDDQLTMLWHSLFSAPLVR